MKKIFTKKKINRWMIPIIALFLIIGLPGADLSAHSSYSVDNTVKRVQVGLSAERMTVAESQNLTGYSVELSYLHIKWNANLVGACIDPTFWAATGMRCIDADERIYSGYIEGGLYLLFNVGGGVTISNDNPLLNRVTYHFTAGLPIWPFLDYVYFTVQPYVRIMKSKDDETIRSYGVCVNYSLYLFSRTD